MIAAASWRVASVLAEPALRLLLRIRLARGKELPGRVAERRGIAGVDRPAGRLLWLHAASVGETVSLMAVLEAVCAQDPELAVLMTTGSVTSQFLLAQTLREAGLQHRVLQQFVPLDVPRWWRRFHDHWRPQALALVESELWPNMIEICAARKVALALVNARLSERSADRWKSAHGFVRQMLARFDWITARSEEDAGRLRALGAVQVEMHGDLKAAARPLAADMEELARIDTELAGRPVFLAACTHEAEEAVIAEAHRIAAARIPRLLTIVAPRHPERAGAIMAALGALPCRSLGQMPAAIDPIWLFDTIGEMGLLYRLARLAFIGNSLASVRGAGGGHNPLEPARLGCAVCVGPRSFNFNDAIARLSEARALGQVADAAEIARWVGDMIERPDLRNRASVAGLRIAEQDEALPGMVARRLIALARQQG